MNVATGNFFFAAVFGICDKPFAGGVTPTGITAFLLPLAGDAERAQRKLQLPREPFHYGNDSFCVGLH